MSRAFPYFQEMENRPFLPPAPLRELKIISVSQRTPRAAGHTNHPSRC